MDGVHPELVIGPSTEIIAGNGLILTAGGVDCHVHLISPTQIPEALGSGVTTWIAGGTGPADGTKATTVTPGRLVRRADPGVARRVAAQRGAARQGQHGRRRRAARAGRGRHLRVQAARGLGLHPGRDRRLPAGGRPDRGPGGHPHRHPERGRLRGRHAGRDRRPGHPRLPHRGRRRRARAGHHHRGRPAERAAQLDQPDPAAHRQHRRRAPRHADGLPPPQAVGAGGPGVRRDAASARRPSPPRTCCTTWAPSR